MDLTEFLGRPPTAAEAAIFRDQQSRLGPGIFDNPLLGSAPGDGLDLGTVGLMTIRPSFEPEPPR